MSTNRRVALLAVLLLLEPVAALAQPAAPLTMFAAASLTDSLKAVADAYKAKTGASITLSFGASSTLARQIEQGAPADIFISADTDWMDYLQKAGLIADATRKDLLGNQLVLVAASGAKPGRHRPAFRLGGRVGRRQTGAGRSCLGAGWQIWQSRADRVGVWDSVSSKVAPAENVRVALEYVARGEAPYGIVYATDAKVAPGVHVAGGVSGKHPCANYLSGCTDQSRLAGGARSSWPF